MDHVAILMATYNGARFIEEQLASIESQTHQNWSLWVSDDGSKDGTLDVINKFRDEYPKKVQLLKGPGKGFLRNFLELVNRKEIKSDFVAFCDQDDIWHPNKLEKAVNWLRQQPDGVPSLYCSRTRTVDALGCFTGYSPVFSRQPCFANALVQSIAGGNTMVLNQRAREMMMLIRREAVVPSHDWWAYVVVTAVGGSVHYDPVATIDYRQHEGNQVGANRGLTANLKRLILLREGRFRLWNGQHLHALNQIKNHLAPENLKTLELFEAVHRGNFLQRMCAAWKANIHRQTFAGNLTLLLAVVLKKV